MNKNALSPGDYSNNANSNHLEKGPKSELSGNVVGSLQKCVKRERMTTKPSITPREARSRTSKTNGDAGARFLIARGGRKTAPPMQPRSRFNWRGNRPRMGKRSMCPLCGGGCSGPAGRLCMECGEREVVDVSYDDPPQNNVQ